MLHGLPHACGGVSWINLPYFRADESSPRLWGCFQAQAALCPQTVVFPTPVGVFLIQDVLSAPMYSLPHACGGVSVVGPTLYVDEPSSPRLWGCFRPHELFCAVPAVFPTPVGVFLKHADMLAVRFRLPHACGGVSYDLTGGIVSGESSPRLWGCFSVRFHLNG